MSHKFTLLVLLISLSFTTIADVELLPSHYKFVRHSLGIEMVKPDNWRFTNTSSVRKLADNKSNESLNLRGKGRKLGSVEHVVTIVYHEEVFFGLKPSIFVAKLNKHDISPMEYVYKRISSKWSADPGFKINIHPMDTTIGGRPATYSNTSYDITLADGAVEFMLDYWVIERDDHFLILSYASPSLSNSSVNPEKLKVIREEVSDILNGIVFTK